MAGKKNTSTKKKTNTKKKAPQKQGSIFATPIFIHGAIWAVLFMFTALFMYINTDAVLAEASRSVLGGVFGVMAYMIPIVFGGTLIYLAYNKSVKMLWLKFSLTLMALICLCSIIGIFADYGTGSAYEICSQRVTGGGVVGVAVAEFLENYIGAVASFIILFILFIVLACVISRVNIIPYIEKGIKWVWGYTKELSESAKEKRDARLFEEEEVPETTIVFGDGHDPLTDRKLSHNIPESDKLPESLSKRIGKKQRRGNENAMDVVNDFADDVMQGRVVTNEGVYKDDVTGEEKFDLYNMDFARENGEDVTPDGEVKPPREKNLTEIEKEVYKGEIENALSEEIIEYTFPTLDLLNKAKHVENDKRRELYTKAEQLISVLDNFGVKAKPVQVTQGPTVTRYEIQPESGTKLSKIIGLADDIALNLAVATVLIAPVPNKAGIVGVEIPNNNVTPVTIREMLDSPEFKNAKSKLTVCLGKDIGGNVVVGDIAKWPHALIAGATGSGKSVCINTIVTSILYKADPSEVKLIMVDPKQVELGIYNGIPHLLIPVVTEAKKAAGALNWAVTEMMRRYELFKNTGVRKIDVYNKQMEKTGGEKLPQIVIIIDELADLMMVAAKEVEDYVCRLAQLARAAGIYLIIATQRPSVDVITGLIKANIPSRIAFFVSSQVDSRTIIDKAGAEKLLGMGDMLYFPAGARATTRVQGAFVSDEEVERIVEFIKDSSPETHYREDLEEHIERISLGENGVTPDKEEDGDALLPDAIELAMSLGNISTSMIQRRLGVGYSRAGRIIDQMEARGIISPANGSKPRDVLVSHADMLFDSPSEEDFDE